MERVPLEADAAEAREATAGRARRLAAGGGVLAVVAALAYWLGSFGGGGEPGAPRPVATPTPSATPLTVAEVFQRAGPSVAVVRSGRSLGTGVIVADDGTILTARHVVTAALADDGKNRADGEGGKGGQRGGGVTVTFADGTRTRAVVVSSNPRRDIAALKPAKPPEIVVPATLGGTASVGAPVVAIGNPLGLTFSVSSGVVSGLDRTADDGPSGLIQFDASVNPGSSGGPLLDEHGGVIGIVVSIADPGGDDAFAGIAFAVPIGAALGGGDGDGPGGGPQL